MAIEKITVPDLGDAGEVEVIELLVAVGDTVAENDSLLVLESDKAAMEIPAPMAGVVKSIAVNLGDQVSTGTEILSLEVTGEVASEAASTEPEPQSQTKAASEPEPEPEPKTEPAITAATVPEPETKSAAPVQATSQVIDVPDLGTDDEVEVIEIHVKAGDAVDVDDSLITLESDKAAMEVPAPTAGTVESLLVAVGDKVKTGAPILKLLSSQVSPAQVEQPAAAEPAAAAPASPQPASTPAPKPASTPASMPAPTQPSASATAPASGKVYAGPAVRKLARELGVDLTQVAGSGAKSRIVKEDIHEFVKARINAPAAGQSAGVAAAADIDFSQFGEIEQVARTKLQKVTAINMQRNWNSIPAVAQFNEADITELEEFRNGLKPEAERRGTKLTFMPFLLKACAKALAEHPQFNVSLHSSGEYVVQKKYVHIGMAVATDAGLLVPVIRDVDKKSVWELASEVLELSAKAKQRKLTLNEMQGACFTISSLGAIGGTGFIPIINAPEVAILGVSATTIKPVYIDGEFQPRKMLPITLTYDHKVVNGVDGGMFADYLVRVLADIRHLIL